MGEECMATVTLKNELGKTTTRNIRAILNGTYTEDRQGLILTPPVKPERWEIDQNTGQPIAVNPLYNIGFGSQFGEVCIVEGYYQTDGTIRWSIRNQTVSFAGFNSSTWMAAYAPYTYKIDNLCMEVKVNKRKGSYYN
jgi:hypothetical protein